MVPNVELNIL